MLRKAAKLIADLVAVRRYASRKTFRSYFVSVIATFPEIVRTNSLVPADRRMKGRQCHFTPLPGGSITLSGDYFSGAREMYCRRVYFRLPGFEIGRDDTVLDVGANRGLFTTMAAVYGRSVVAIEAQASMVAAIEENLVANDRFDSATVLVGLVGDSSGLLRTDEVKVDQRVWEERPPLLDIADVLRRHNVKSIDLMKVDIEGSEFALITPAAGWLTRVCRIVMEVHVATGGNIGELRRTLAAYGFNTWLTEAHSARIVDHIQGTGGYLFARRASSDQ